MFGMLLRRARAWICETAGRQLEVVEAEVLEAEDMLAEASALLLTLDWVLLAGYLQEERALQRWQEVRGRVFSDPAARVIHCTRDAVDTSLSCYFQNFGATQPFSTRLEWIGHRVRQCHRAMAAFSAAAPMPLLEVSYEKLVSDQDAQIRKLVEFVGLPWHGACLQPELNRRVGLTASYHQINQPIYPHAVGRAQHYAQWLEPLRDALAS